jgi:ribosomal protein S18 acetylase RimI-like enzyme
MRDLPHVADLIELCFESTMDDDGQSYVQQMRKASRDSDFLAWAGRVMDSASMPLAGFVWEEDGKIVGNTSLVMQVHRGRKVAMIANVATHPNHRRRGIGRALTEGAMLAARRKGAKELWLQVRGDNATAIKIYTGLGFVERARRTTYHMRGGLDLAASGVEPVTEQARQGQGVSIGRPAGHQWLPQREWILRAHPEELSWYWHWDWERLGPGLRNMLHRAFMQYEMRQWAATLDGEPRAWLGWIPDYRSPHALWLAAEPPGGIAVTRLLEQARRELAHFHKLTIEHPAGELQPEIEAAGFAEFRTLMWMRATGA